MNIGVMIILKLSQALVNVIKLINKPYLSVILISILTYNVNYTFNNTYNIII